tara:strand:- start:73 stop:201 length:129 start_codon:yes stop_codon:yes gene_type:complete
MNAICTPKAETEGLAACPSVAKLTWLEVDLMEVTAAPVETFG